MQNTPARRSAKIYHFPSGRSVEQAAGIEQQEVKGQAPASDVIGRCWYHQDAILIDLATRNLEEKA